MSRAIKIRDEDDVFVALDALDAGTEITGGLSASMPIPAGHKIAAHCIALGSEVRKFGQVIGVAVADIPAGSHVHTHNVSFAGQADRSTFGCDLHLPERPAVSAQFSGYRRVTGRFGTRNYIGILTSVNCSATVAKRIGAHFSPSVLAAFPNVDGVVALTHSSGCGMAHHGDGIDNLKRTLAGYVRNPNFAAVLIVGLGCEVNQTDELLDDHGLFPSDRLRVLSIQEAGGTPAAIAAGAAAVAEMLPIADLARRTPVPASQLIVGLQCGGSDGYSALTANPALGIASDLVVAHGGTVILSETPEIYGAENLLLRRAINSTVANSLLDRLRWWEEYAARNGADLNNNPSPGNIAGGITTILEKSLGAVAKSGSTPLVDVLRYAEQVRLPGLTFMDTPGYDPCSATGQIAGGANLVVFTTGRGSVFGSKPSPTIKVSSNSELARRMPEDIDIDCGRILSGEVDLEELGHEIFDLILATASGKQTASEINDMGESEFVPWVPGAAM